MLCEKTIFFESNILKQKIWMCQVRENDAFLIFYNLYFNSKISPYPFIIVLSKYDFAI